MRFYYLNKTPDWLRNYFNFHRITWQRKMCILLVSGASVTGDSWSHSLRRSKSQDHGPWGLVGESPCLLLQSLLFCPLLLDTESLKEAWSPPEGNGSRTGVGNNQDSSAHPNSSLASGLPLYLVLSHPCAWRTEPEQQESDVLCAAYKCVPCMLSLHLKFLS